MSHLTQEQRYTIEILYNEKYSQADIAKIICRDRSVFNRELQRNSDKRNSVYKADLAERKCKQRHLEKPKKIRFTKAIKDFVIYYLKKDYSPEQIVGKSKLEGLACVSLERIYQYVWEDKKKGGDFEIDLVIGKDHKGALITANDRAAGKVKISIIDSQRFRNCAKRSYKNVVRI